MRALIYCLLFVNFSGTFAIADVVPESSSVQFYYFESYPRTKLKLEISAPSGCLPKEPLRQFESQVKLPSAETGKLVPVRVVHLYSKSFGECAAKNSIETKSVEIKGHPRRMTHIFLTAAPGWKVAIAH